MWDIYLQDESKKISENKSVYPEKEFCVWLADHFTTFVESMVSNSTDERRKLLASYIIAVREFKMFFESIRVGDRLYQEYSVLQFIGCFLLLKKHVYVELCLNAIEREYNDIDYRSLMDIRINSCVKYKVEKNSNGELHTAVALDEM